MGKKGGKRDNAGRKKKLSGLLKPVYVGMTDEMYRALCRLEKQKRIPFQKMMREMCRKFIEENLHPEDKTVL